MLQPTYHSPDRDLMIEPALASEPGTSQAFDEAANRLHRRLSGAIPETGQLLDPELQLAALRSFRLIRLATIAASTSPRYTRFHPAAAESPQPSAQDVESILRHPKTYMYSLGMLALQPRPIAAMGYQMAGVDRFYQDGNPEAPLRYVIAPDNRQPELPGYMAIDGLGVAMINAKIGRSYKANEAVTDRPPVYETAVDICITDPKLVPALLQTQPE